MKKRINLCHVCRSKIEKGNICDKCKKVAKEEAVQMRKNVEEALQNEK
jgi:predicted amidophosphoribosyltransferase